MFGSTVLEVGVGVTLLFLFVSLICTAFQEGIEIILKSRAADLERGVRLLLHDKTGEGPARSFFNHPLIYSLFSGDYRPGKLEDSRSGGLVMPRKHRSGLPSYIPAANFSAALIDLVATGKLASAGAPAQGAEPKPLPATPAEWRKAAALIANPEIREAVRAAFELGGGDLDAARANLETWYNGTMDRVSGWYKRRSQRSLVVVGFLIAVGLNIDAVTVVRELSDNATLRAEAVSAAGKISDGGEKAGLAIGYEEARAAIASIGYPVGWQPAPQLRACRSAEANGSGNGLAWSQDGSWTLGRCGGGQFAWLGLQALVGWFATALAVMLGAPFWFDVLNKFMVIRSTVKSYEKSTPEGSEDRRPAPAGPVVATRSRGMPRP